MTALVPIYNGLGVLRRLVASLAQTYPRPEPLLSFVFLDDASPDPEVAAWLAADAFFRRPDTRVVTSPRNLGFADNVNHGLRLADPASDILLLNSDTEVHGDAVRVLQEVAWRHPRVASVTPLSNQATIASLFRWPDGTADLHGFTAAELTAMVEESGERTPLHAAPTGVGFCMYLPRPALEAVGLFDGATFGKGYGEENDWCQRAARRGFVNLICTETFVYHQGTQSFTSAEKSALLGRNQDRLRARHPGYVRDVMRYIADDPLLGPRTRLLWRLGRGRKERAGLETLTFVLHAEPAANRGGGTERHVEALTQQILLRGTREVFHIFPDGPGAYRVRLQQPGAPGALFDFTYQAERVGGIVQAVLAETEVLHIQHLLHLDPYLLSLLREARCRRKIFTAHDFFTICPSITLVGEQGQFCGVPADSASCNRCLGQRHGYTAESIELYRRRLKDFLSTVDQVLVPSESAREVLTRGLAAPSSLAGDQADNAALVDKVAVLENFLFFGGERHMEELSAAAPAAVERKLVYLGALFDHKGAQLARACLSRLMAAGYQVEVWGGYDGSGGPHGHLVRPYADWRELLGLVRSGRPYVVCMPFTWPETFSFTTFEAITVVRAPLLVGPFGNPARLVRELGVGVVMADSSPAAFFAALDELVAGHARYTQRIEQVWQSVVLGKDPGAYLDRLEAIYGPPQGRPQSRVSADHLPEAVAHGHAGQRKQIEQLEQQIQVLFGYVGHLEQVLKRPLRERAWGRLQQSLGPLRGPLEHELARLHRQQRAVLGRIKRLLSGGSHV